MNSNTDKNEHIYKAVDSAIKIGFISLLVIWGFSILKPLLGTVIWGVIIAVAIFPSHQKLSKLVGGKEGVSAAILTIIGIGVLVIPTFLFVDSTIGSIQGVANTLEKGRLNIAPPGERVASLPFIGRQVHDSWQMAATNLEGFLLQLKPQLKGMAPKVLSTIAALGITVVQFILSTIVAGIILVNAKSTVKGANRVCNILVGGYVDDFPKIAAATIRSVVQGVLGIAVIQALLSGLGMVVMGIPAAGFWTLLILILVIVQMPPMLILLPIAGYTFTITGTVPAVMFLIWCIFVGLLDNILKPILLGRGVDIPMLVILLGAIGGMITSGIIGLFIGPIILALGYKVFGAIMDKNESRNKVVIEEESSK